MQLQKEEPMIHVLRRELLQLVQNLLVKFVRPNTMVATGSVNSGF